MEDLNNNRSELSSLEGLLKYIKSTRVDALKSASKQEEIKTLLLNDIITLIEDCLSIMRVHFNLVSITTLARSMLERAIDIFFVHLSKNNYKSLYLFSYEEDLKLFKDMAQLPKHGDDAKVNETISGISRDIATMNSQKAKSMSFHSKVMAVDKSFNNNVSVIYVAYRELSRAAHSNILSIIERNKIHSDEKETEKNKKTVISVIATIFYHSYLVSENLPKDEIAFQHVKNIIKTSHPQMDEYFKENDN